MKLARSKLSSVRLHRARIVLQAKLAPRATSSAKPARSRKAAAKAPAAEETDDIPF